MLALLIVILVVVLSGCAGLSPHEIADRPIQTAYPPTTDTPLGALVARQNAPDGESGFRLLSEGSIALDARLSLIRAARRSIDLQTFELADDELGHLIMRALRDAAARGVRVRVLLDDFNTEGMDRVLLGLAAFPNVELRLFNPFGLGRPTAASRLINLAADLRRLHHRMHNKLMVADSAVAIIGGRNLSSAYFVRDTSSNFIDMEALAAGPIATELATVFDTYWNSPVVREFGSVVARTGLAPGVPEAESPATRRAWFDARVADAHEQGRLPPLAHDGFGVLPVSAELALGHLSLHHAKAVVMADPPDKADPRLGRFDITRSVSHRIVEYYGHTRQRLMIMSPYFVPGAEGLAAMKAGIDRGGEIVIVTNLLEDSDEPLAALAYERYRQPMLAMGVQLFEISTRQVRRVREWRDAFGETTVRLHAKLAVIDRDAIIMGSANMDSRSARLNTEIAVWIPSAALATQLLDWGRAQDSEEVQGVYQVKLSPDGEKLYWVALDGGGHSRVLPAEPEEYSPWVRLRLWLASWLIPEDWL